MYLDQSLTWLEILLLHNRMVFDDLEWALVLVEDLGGSQFQLYTKVNSR
jgi:hypothetical protein